MLFAIHEILTAFLTPRDGIRQEPQASALGEALAPAEPVGARTKPVPIVGLKLLAGNVDSVQSGLVGVSALAQGRSAPQYTVGDVIGYLTVDGFRLGIIKSVIGKGWYVVHMMTTLPTPEPAYRKVRTPDLICVKRKHLTVAQLAALAAANNVEDGAGGVGTTAGGGTVDATDGHATGVTASPSAKPPSKRSRTQEASSLESSVSRASVSRKNR